MTQKQRIIVICIHNSARSQMAEAFLKHHGGDRFEVQSAGLEAGVLNPLVVKAMAEKGLDISGNKTKKAMDFVARGERFDFVVTVCDETSAERCPIFPGVNLRLHWSFPDPSVLTGTDDEKLMEIRKTRDAIEQKVTSWLAER